jgi:hypothetical protein
LVNRRCLIDYVSEKFVLNDKKQTIILAKTFEAIASRPKSNINGAQRDTWQTLINEIIQYVLWLVNKKRGGVLPKVNKVHLRY